MIYTDEYLNNSNIPKKKLAEQYQQEVVEHLLKIYSNVIENLSKVLKNSTSSVKTAKEILADPYKTAMFIDTQEQLEFYKNKLEGLTKELS